MFLSAAILCCSVRLLPLDQAVFDRCMASPARAAQVEAIDRKNTSDLLSKFGRAAPPALHRHALKRLVQASPVLKGSKVVLVGYRGKALNAHEADHNVIIISAAAWDREQNLSDDEIAAMLAHEVAHLERKDSQRMACESLAYASNAELALPSAIRETSREAFSGESELAATLAARGQAREQAADARGAQLLEQAGYDPLAMARMLRKLAPAGPFSSGSHPALDRRIQNVLDSVRKGAGSAASL